MKCATCLRTLAPGQKVVPVMTVHESGRYDPAPSTVPEEYIHLSHFAFKEGETR